MRAPSPPLHRRPPERLAAWVVTGPLGHLWSVVADLASFALRTVLAKARRRLSADGIGAVLARRERRCGARPITDRAAALPRAIGLRSRYRRVAGAGRRSSERR